MYSDELQTFKQSAAGEIYSINDNISIRTPTLGEICDFGEHKYYSMVTSLVASPSTYKVALWDMGVDWETIDDWQFFVWIRQTLHKEDTHILLGDLDLSKLKLAHNPQTNQPILVSVESNGEEKLVVDRAVYTLFADYVRNIHGFEYKIDRAENKSTKEYMIRRERRTIEKNKNASHKSILKTLISSMITQQGFDYNYQTVWDLSIYAFNESVNRTKKFLDYVQTLQAAYSGADMKNIDWDELYWLN